MSFLSKLHNWLPIISCELSIIQHYLHLEEEKLPHARISSVLQCQFWRLEDHSWTISQESVNLLSKGLCFSWAGNVQNRIVVLDTLTWTNAGSKVTRTMVDGYELWDVYEKKYVFLFLSGPLLHCFCYWCCCCRSRLFLYCVCTFFIDYIYIHTCCNSSFTFLKNKTAYGKKKINAIFYHLYQVNEVNRHL